jgi:hypothetical protein
VSPIGAVDRVLLFLEEAADIRQAAFLHHPPRGQVHGHGLRHHAVDAVLGKALVDQGAGSFGRIAVSPGRPAEPVTQIDGSVASARPEVKPAQEVTSADVVGGPGAEPRVLVVERQVERDDFVPDLVPAGLR